ncbi:MAG: hypothetical protein AAF960_15465 [Bacteroidota bacterium]
MVSLLRKIALFTLLTMLTQIGGIAYLLYQPISKYCHRKSSGIRRIGTKILGFSTIYLFLSLVIVPPIAIKMGRVPLPYFASSKIPLQPQTLLTCLANRHYVRKELALITTDLAKALRKEFPQTTVNYLDANFPFWDGFPLLPHLSHNDGKKLDLAFFYKDKATGKPVQTSPSFMGYGVCESPKKGELNQPAICAKEGFFQYSLLEKITPQWNKQKMPLDEQRTKRLLILLAESRKIRKIFIEPHLKKRWGLSKFPKIRFHGCHAVRHDDHIHLQL